MPYYSWSEDLSVKIPSIDRQHQVLIGYINELHIATGNGDIRNLTSAVLEKLVNYTHVHFIYEEMLFGTYQYAQEAEHKKSHQYFIDEISRMNEALEAGDEDIPIKLLQFLKNWLNNHILIEDKAYSDFLISKGVS